MNNKEQLILWVAGDSRCPNDNGECCPDFSCCVPEVQAEKKVRERFFSGTDKDRSAMLGMFLGAALGTLAPDKQVHVVDGTDPQEH